MPRQLRVTTAPMVVLMLWSTTSLARTWTDRSGNTVEADLLAVAEGVAHLFTRSDRAILRVPISQLSDDDRRFVQNISAPGESPFYILLNKRGKASAGILVGTSDVSYRFQRRNGGVFSLPRSTLVNAFAGQRVLARFRQKLHAVDVGDDEQFDTLYKYAARWALDVETKQLLESGFRERQEAAAGNAGMLNELAQWCKKYGALEHERECRREAARLDFDKRLAAAGEDGPELAKLADQYRTLGLTDQFTVAAEKAQRLAPYDDDVLELLSPTPWRISVGKTDLISEYSEDYLGTTIKYSPASGMMLASVAVRVKALRAAEQRYERQLSSLADEIERSGPFGEAALETLQNHAQELNRAAGRFFLSTRVRLELDRREIRPGFSAHLPGHGATASGDYVSTWIPTEKDPENPSHFHFRAQGLTAIYLRKRMDLNLTLLFPVPAGTTQATLRFYDVPPVDIRF